MPIRPITKGAAIKEDLLDEEDFEEVIEEDQLEEEEYEDEDEGEDEVMEDEEEEEEEFEEEGEYEEYEDDEDEYYEEERSRLIPYAVMLAALIAFVSLGYYAYNSGTERISDDELMLIQADQTPVKEKPLDPGGLQFPYQDKSVFETITADTTTGRAAQVVSNIEEPMNIEPATPPASAAAPQAIEEKPLEVVATTTPAIAEQQPVGSAPKAEAMVKEVEPVRAEVPKPEAPKAVAEAVTSSSGLKGADTVQLGAYRSSGDAQAAWEKIRAQHSALSGFTPTIIRADLGDKGIFHRLRVPQANGGELCGKLKTAGQPCMLVK